MQTRVAASSTSRPHVDVSTQISEDSRIHREPSTLVVQHHADPFSENVTSRTTEGGKPTVTETKVEQKRSLPGIGYYSKRKKPQVPVVPSTGTCPDVSARTSRYRLFPRIEARFSAEQAVKASNNEAPPSLTRKDIPNWPSNSLRTPVRDHQSRRQKSMPGVTPSFASHTVASMPRNARATSSVRSRGSLPRSGSRLSLQPEPAGTSSMPLSQIANVDRVKRQESATEMRACSMDLDTPCANAKMESSTPSQQSQPDPEPKTKAEAKHDSGDPTWSPGRPRAKLEAKGPSKIPSTRTDQLRTSKSMPKLCLSSDSMSRIPRLSNLPADPRGERPVDRTDPILSSCTASVGGSPALKRKTSRVENFRKRSIYFQGTAHRAESTMQIVDMYSNGKGVSKVPGSCRAEERVAPKTPEPGITSCEVHAITSPKPRAEPVCEHITGPEESMKIQQCAQSGDDYPWNVVGKPGLRKPRPSKRDTVQRQTDWTIPEYHVPKRKSSLTRGKPISTVPGAAITDNHWMDAERQVPGAKSGITGDPSTNSPEGLPEQVAASKWRGDYLRRLESDRKLWSEKLPAVRKSEPSTPSTAKLRQRELTPTIRIHRSADSRHIKDRIAQWEESLLLPVSPTPKQSCRNASSLVDGLGISPSGSPSGNPRSSTIEIQLSSQESSPSKLELTVKKNRTGVEIVAVPESTVSMWEWIDLAADNPRTSEDSVASRPADWPLVSCLSPSGNAFG